MVFDEGNLFAASNEGTGEVLDLDEWKAMYVNTTSSGSTKESMNQEATKREATSSSGTISPGTISSKSYRSQSKTSGSPAEKRRKF